MVSCLPRSEASISSFNSRSRSRRLIIGVCVPALLYTGVQFETREMAVAILTLQAALGEHNMGPGIRGQHASDAGQFLVFRWRSVRRVHQG